MIQPRVCCFSVGLHFDLLVSALVVGFVFHYFGQRFDVGVWFVFHLCANGLSLGLAFKFGLGLRCLICCSMC
jgi:hypothetical protein